MKVGPKGQVVIPRAFRKNFNISPGSTVFFEIKNGELVIEKPETDISEKLRKIASGKNEKIHPHEAYEEELEHRLKKIEGRIK